MTAAPGVLASGWLTAIDAGAWLSVALAIDAAQPIARLEASVGDSVARVVTTDGRAVSGLRVRAPMVPGAYAQRVTVVDACDRVTTRQGPLVTVRPPRPPAHTLTIATPASGAPNPAPVTGGPVQVSVGVVDSHGHAVSYLWQSSCAETMSGGTFTPSAGVPEPLWHPPTGARACLIRVTAIDPLGLSVSSSYVQTRQ